MEELLKNLKEHVTCSICLDSYTEPKTIDCLHTFCCECLEKHALTSQRQGFYRCPECQARVGIPEGKRFDRLPSSFLHNSLLSLLAVRRSHDGNEIGCSFCQKKSAEINYCFDCEKFLCPDCIKAHDLSVRTAAFEGHKVTPVRQFQPEDYEVLLKRQSFCSQKYHEREVTRFFCLHDQCQICVCHVSIVTDHKSHDIVPLEKTADDEKANTVTEAERMREKIQACSDLIRQFETTEAELETNITIAKRQVSETAERMVAKIREREREVIALLEETRVLRIEKLHSAKELVLSLEKQRKQAVEFTNNLVQRSSSSDIMQSKKNLEQRFKVLAEAKVPPLPVSSFVKFVPTSDSLKLGFTVFNDIDVHRSTVEGLSQNFQAGKVAELSISPKTSEGEISNNEQDQVEVLVEPADQVATLTICKQQDRKFQVKFVANVPQTYNVTVKINGKSLANGPFSIRVKERRFDVVGGLKLNTGKVALKPRGIAANSKGLIAVVDRKSHSIFIFDKEGKHLGNVGGHGHNAGQLQDPADVTFLNDDEILVADELNHRIQQFNVQSGEFVKSFGKKGTGDGEFKNPSSVCMDNKGHVVVTEHVNNRIQVLTKDGIPVFKFGNREPTLNRPSGCVCHKNMFIVSDWGNHCLKVYDGSGRFLHKIGKEGEADGQLKTPVGLCVDKYGNILVCDRGNNRIQQFTIEGGFTGKHVVNRPWGVTLTPDGGILFSESLTSRVLIMK